MKVFFYGSLMRKFPQKIFTSPHIVPVKEDTIGGVMYSFGRFPAVVEGEGVIHGEVHELVGEGGKAMLDSLDSFEGYHEESPERSMYLRKEVITDSGEQVYVYIYNGNPHGEIVPDGDWFKHCNGVNKI